MCQWSTLSWLSLPRFSTVQPVLRNAGASLVRQLVTCRAFFGQSFGGCHSPGGVTCLSSAADVPSNGPVSPLGDLAGEGVVGQALGREVLSLVRVPGESLSAELGVHGGEH